MWVSWYRYLYGIGEKVFTKPEPPNQKYVSHNTNFKTLEEKIELQVNQAAFKVNEAGKKLVMSTKNMEKAEENLRYATLGFKEGVIATSNVLEAQTAWLSAQSEKIDAQIDVKINRNLSKEIIRNS